jgi:predicted naringenin-chalcone synthase
LNTLADIISIGTAVPPYAHQQKELLSFMQQAYGLDATDRRKLAFLYHQSAIETRYSVLPDFSKPQQEWGFWPTDGNTFPNLDARMNLYQQEALPLSIQAIQDCLKDTISTTDITHLITVSCTGMSAPGLDLQIAESLQLSPTLFRTSVNFMGCYAAIHALKLAKMICDSTPNSNVVIVATELCTIHFQQEYTMDNAAGSLLFADGASAVLVSNQMDTPNRISLKGFYSKIVLQGKEHMAWQINTKGFLMTLSSYIPQLVEADIEALVTEALDKENLEQEDVDYWCIHPGGKKILDNIQKQLQLMPDDLCYSRKVLANYGNMSSATILFVLKGIMDNAARRNVRSANIFGAAFGPGLTMETFTATVVS